MAKSRYRLQQLFTIQILDETLRQREQ